MASYVETHMRDAFAEHKLRCLTDRAEATVYRMGRAGTNTYSVYIAEFANRLCLTGDTRFGPNDSNGVVSSLGYGIPWFTGHLSEGYLCEKFLRPQWQWEAAVEAIRWHIKEDGQDDWWAENAAALRHYMADPSWTYDMPDERDYYKAMVNLGHDGCELPGYDYPRAEAGWLCAAQQRFRKLRSPTLPHGTC